MSNKLRNFTLALCFVTGLACVVVAGQRARVPVAKQEKEQSFASALRESVPPVRIYAKHIVFNQMVRIERVESLTADGRPSRAPAVLKAIGSGLVIDAGGRAARIDVDDLLAVGDWIIGGVAENAGDHPVRIIFDGGREMTLQPGEVLYVGTYERLLRPDQIPGAQGAAAGLLETGIGQGSPTHCWYCECNCGSPTKCTVSMSATHGTNCGNYNGERCVCVDGQRGNLSGCTLTSMPCAM